MWGRALSCVLAYGVASAVAALAAIAILVADAPAMLRFILADPLETAGYLMAATLFVFLHALPMAVPVIVLAERSGVERRAAYVLAGAATGLLALVLKSAIFLELPRAVDALAAFVGGAAGGLAFAVTRRLILTVLAWLAPERSIA